jgi:hypothetical protein
VHNCIWYPFHEKTWKIIDDAIILDKMDVTVGVSIIVFILIMVLSWRGGGGCDGYEMRGCGGEVLIWRCWIGRHWCVVDVVCDWLLIVRDSPTAFKSVKIIWVFFWVYVGFQICWDLQISLYLIGLFHVDVDCFGGRLRAETYLSKFSCYHCSVNFWPAKLLCGFQEADHFWLEIGS